MFLQMHLFLFFMSFISQVVAGINPTKPARIQIGSAKNPINRVRDEVINSPLLNALVFTKLGYLAL